VYRTITAPRLDPGTALTVRSTRYPAVMHWGVVDYALDPTGNPRMWHSQKSDVLRCTDFAEFSGGHPCQIEWTPENPQQGRAVIQRLRSQEGLPWHLTQANCETVTRWAIEDKPVSRQLQIGTGALILFGIFVAAVAADSN
jgi:hypothetical protein